ncbi:MAG: ABC transporter permease [Candidatus Riflebacteria bacterium]|nr:ABC transporter permease [Candidatus Riflebacteria bacterium]
MTDRALDQSSPEVGPPEPPARAKSATPEVAPRRSTGLEAGFKLLVRNPLTLSGALGSLALCAVALLGPWMTLYPTGIESLTRTLHEALLPPSLAHPFGTDWHGSDVLSKVILGTRISLTIGIFASLLSMVIGVIVGVLSGYFGGWLDTILMRLTDVVLAFPSLLLTILIAASLGSGLTSVFLALTVSGWAGTGRMVRGLVLSLREREYVLAAVAAGAGPTRIVTRHILPNCLSTLIVLFTMRIGITILSEASLNFLGLGAPSDAPSWGVMVFYGMDHMRQAPWCSIWPASAIALTVLCFNFLGDGLRDALDPRMRDVL